MRSEDQNYPEKTARPQEKIDFSEAKDIDMERRLEEEGARMYRRKKGKVAAELTLETVSTYAREEASVRRWRWDEGRPPGKLSAWMHQCDGRLVTAR